MVGAIREATAASISTWMGDRDNMSISGDSLLNETLVPRPLALL